MSARPPAGALVVLVASAIALAGCVSVNTVVRDPKTGQTEACNVTFTS